VDERATASEHATFGKDLARGIRDVAAAIGLVLLLLWGFGVAVSPPSGQTMASNAFVGAGTIAKVAELSLVTRDSTCPTLDDLVAGKLLDGAKVADPWGNPYRIDCGAGVRVSSVGADGILATPDDVLSDMTRDEVREVRAMAATRDDGRSAFLLPLAVSGLAVPALLSSIWLPASFLVIKG